MKPVKLPPTSLLELEDVVEILSYVCPRSGVPLWAMVRWDVLDGLLQWTWTEDDHAPTAARPRQSHRVSHLLKASGRDAVMFAHGTPASLLVVGNTAVRTLTRGGRPFNPLTDYFVEITPSSRAMEVPDLDNVGTGRPGVLDQYPMRAAARLAGRARRREVTGVAQALVEWLRVRTSDLLGLDAPPAFLTQWARLAAERAASLSAYEAMWSTLLRRLDVRVVIKIDGCYGGAENVALLRAARQTGVLVAEHQHGVVNRSHMAYNYAPTLLRSTAYAETLPPVILTYGSWWHEAFSVPSRLEPLGHPHRHAMSPTLTTPGDARTDLLVLGNAVDTAESLTFCREVRDLVPEQTVVAFRPHPGERQRAKELAGAHGLERVHLDLSDDLYRSLGSARAVIAEASTGLYEAVGLVPQIFVWGNQKGIAFSSDAPFDMATDARDFVAALDEPGRGAPAPGLDDAMWAPDWQSRFAAFVSDYGVHVD